MHYNELKAAWAELTGTGTPFEIERIPIRGSPTLSYKAAPPTGRESILKFSIAARVRRCADHGPRLIAASTAVPSKSCSRSSPHWK